MTTTMAPALHVHMDFLDSALQKVLDAQPDTAVTTLADTDSDQWDVLLTRECKSPRSGVFTVVFAMEADDNAAFRARATDAGANMVTGNIEHLVEALRRVAEIRNLRGELICPICHKHGLCALAFCKHMPLFHINEPNGVDHTCPICLSQTDNLQVHTRHEHLPRLDPTVLPENHRAESVYSFSLVVVQRRDGKMLLCQEFGRQGFWLPGGRVDPGETLQAAAVRETQEEAGVAVQLTGLLNIRYAPHRGYSRLTAVFHARPIDDAARPKSVPDYESLVGCVNCVRQQERWVSVARWQGAVWVAPHELMLRHRDGGLPTRGPEPYQWAKYLLRGGTIYPLSILAHTR